MYICIIINNVYRITYFLTINTRFDVLIKLLIYLRVSNNYDETVLNITNNKT